DRRSGLRELNAVACIYVHVRCVEVRVTETLGWMPSSSLSGQKLKCNCLSDTITRACTHYTTLHTTHYTHHTLLHTTHYSTPHTCAHTTIYFLRAVHFTNSITF